MVHKWVLEGAYWAVLCSHSYWETQIDGDKLGVGLSFDVTYNNDEGIGMFPVISHSAEKPCACRG